MGRRAYRRSKTAADADHQGNKESLRFVAQLDGCMVHDRKEHRAGCRIGDKLCNKSGYQTYRRHHDDGIRAAYIQYSRCHPLRNTGFLNSQS